MFDDVAERIRKNFFETAKMYINEEKNRGVNLKKHTEHCEEKLKKVYYFLV